MTNQNGAPHQGGTPPPTATVPSAPEVMVTVPLPAPHHELLRTTRKVLSHFYPATAAPLPLPTADDSDTAAQETAAEELVEECGSPLDAAPAPWCYMELPFLSVTNQMRAQAGTIASDDADEHTSLLTLVSLLTRLALPVALA